MNMLASIAFCLVVALQIQGIESGYWGPWSSWTICAKPCSDRIQNRWRVCLGVGLCGDEDKIQSRKCYLAEACATPTEMMTTTKASKPKSNVPKSCYDPDHPEKYRGTESYSETGLLCQAWNSQHPQPHDYTPDRYPKADLKYNYCRSPDEDAKPWCFTTSRRGYWEYCSIPVCPAFQPVLQHAPSTIQCGIRARDRPIGNKAEIVGGEAAGPGAIPWQVTIRKATNKFHFCGGTIINENWILSASHCYFKDPAPSNYYAVLGDYDRSKNEGTEKEVGISTIIIHEDFEKGTFINDIALIKTRIPITFNDFISPICLPETILVENDTVTVSGWGATEGAGRSNVLRKVDIPLVSHNHCRTVYPELFPKMLCAGYLEVGKDACQGDSGGPLYRKAEGMRHELVGIVSNWGLGCGKSGLPGVYTRMSGYVNWVDWAISMEMLNEEE